MEEKTDTHNVEIVDVFSKVKDLTWSVNTQVKKDTERTFKGVDQIIDVKYKQYTQTFIAVIKKVITPNRIGVVLASDANFDLPRLAIANYISISSKKDFEERGISYVELNGNMSIIAESFAVYITGFESNRDVIKPSSNLKSEKALKMLERITLDEGFLTKTYDEMYKELGMSKGSVSNIINSSIMEGLVIRKGPRELELGNLQLLLKTIEELWISIPDHESEYDLDSFMEIMKKKYKDQLKS